jgi:hypothetical protein
MQKAQPSCTPLLEYFAQFKMKGTVSNIWALILKKIDTLSLHASVNWVGHHRIVWSKLCAPSSWLFYTIIKKGHHWKGSGDFQHGTLLNRLVHNYQNLMLNQASSDISKVPEVWSLVFQYRGRFECTKYVYLVWNKLTKHTDKTS